MTELEKTKSLTWTYDGYKESGAVRMPELKPLGSYIQVRTTTGSEEEVLVTLQKKLHSSELEANKEKMGDSKTEKEIPRKVNAVHKQGNKPEKRRHKRNSYVTHSYHHYEAAN